MRHSLLILIAFSCMAAYCDNGYIKYKDPSVQTEERIEDLLSRMTLEEKILQINQLIIGRSSNPSDIGEEVKDIPLGIGSLINVSSEPKARNLMQRKAMEKTQLGIPIIFGMNVMNGFRTIYPIALAQACSFNPSLVQEACAMAAKEAKLSGIDWTFAPMIDVARDPRWGRVCEGYGEDPFLNSVFAVASVKGYQGKSLNDPFSIAACLKHYVGYGASEGGRDYHSSEISSQTLWDTYMPPYKAAIAAGAATVMSAFNNINGIPASANKYTLTEILKKRWKHDGFVVSDWNAIEQLQYQGFAATPQQAALKSFEAGVDMDMKDMLYANHLATLVKESKLSESQINEAVQRVLRIKFRLGLFENPYTPEYSKQEDNIPAINKDVAQKLAEESIVLLKNRNRTLPIKVNRIALVGPMVEATSDFMGFWHCHGEPKEVVSILQGIKLSFSSDTQISHSMGCDFDTNIPDGVSKAVSIANNSDIIILCLGEKGSWSGENRSRSTISLPKAQEDLAQAMAQTGKPIVLVLSSGRPLEITRLEPLASSILQIWQPGTMTGAALANILTGKTNPSGKLAMTFPLSLGQIPVYYNGRPQARYPFQDDGQGRYMDIPNEPLYPFGHGLSYTTYRYEKVSLTSSTIKKDQTLTASIDVYNDGPLDGKESCLWYISDPSCSITRPIKELKHFEKREIKKGEKYTYTFKIDPSRDLSFVDSDGKPLLETGEFYLWVANQKIAFELIE